MNRTHDGRATAESVVLSTGHEVRFPLETAASITGAVVPCSRSAAADLLPAPLSPVGLTPERAVLTFLCVDYHEVSVDGLDPYREFGVLVPALEPDERSVPGVSPFTRGVSGYVWFLPVTTEPARALGVEGWGYPKTVAEISMAETERGRETTVHVDGEHLATVTVDPPPTVGLRLPSRSYTELDGRLVRERLELDGQIGAWPASKRVSIELGSHPRADELRRLDVGTRALFRFAADATFTIHGGVPVDPGRSW
ncbi:acetoacetate decarboxylase family protein [Haloarculaceae archaeon H-GB2-1]|nr:acetoacetate decarboxylase family protein [Haloarculaceae archaeon H-GB1-1]MEA5406929.1 acetoacetate decarboxylase family protein [Haloarculaceae archaeon H-GB2-1]